MYLGIFQVANSQFNRIEIEIDGCKNDTSTVVDLVYIYATAKLEYTQGILVGASVLLLPAPGRVHKEDL